MFAHIIETTVKGTIQGQDYRNVLHFGTDENIQDANYEAILLQLAAALLACWVDVLLPGLSNDFKLEGVEAKRIWPATTNEVVAPVVNGDGGVAGHALPSACSVIVAKKTGMGGAKGQGRMFLPPPLEAHHEDSVLTQDGIDLVVAFVACVAGKFTGAGKTTPFQLGVISRALMKQGQTAQQAFFDVKLLTVRHSVNYLLRRKVGRGS